MSAKRYIVLLFLLFQMAGMAQRGLLNEADVQVVSVLTDTGKIHATINYAKREVNARHQDRFYYSFGGNKIRAMEAGINGIPLHGEYKEYFVDKSIRTTGFFKKGLKHGTWKTWNSEGELIAVCKWRNGIKSKKCLGQSVKQDSIKKIEEVKEIDSTAVKKNKRNNLEKKEKKEKNTKEKKSKRTDKKDKAKQDSEVAPVPEEEIFNKEGKKKKQPKKGWRKQIFKRNQNCPEIEKKTS